MLSKNKTSILFVLALSSAGFAVPAMADSITGIWQTPDGTGYGEPTVNLSDLRGSFVKAAEPLTLGTVPTPDHDFISGSALSAFSTVGFGPSIAEDYNPSPLNISPIFTDAANDFNDTAGYRNAPMGGGVVGKGYSFTFANQSTASTLEFYVGAYDVTAQLSAFNSAGNSVLGNVENGSSWTADSSSGKYGFYLLNVPANLGTVTFDYLATAAGGTGVSNVSIFATASSAASGSLAPVPLPTSAGVGFSMLAAVGGLKILRKRLRGHSVVE